MGVADKRRAIAVEVVYATPEAQAIVALELDGGASLRDAVEASGLLARFPEIDLEINKTGVYATPAALDQRLRDKDRVEIYRPLRADPKEVRRQRARTTVAGTNTLRPR